MKFRLCVLLSRQGEVDERGGQSWLQNREVSTHQPTSYHSSGLPEVQSQILRRKGLSHGCNKFFFNIKLSDQSQMLILIIVKIM